jgi:hypothetical protein
MPCIHCARAHFWTENCFPLCVYSCFEDSLASEHWGICKIWLALNFTVVTPTGMREDLRPVLAKPYHPVSFPTLQGYYSKVQFQVHEISVCWDTWCWTLLSSKQYASESHKDFQCLSTAKRICEAKLQTQLVQTFGGCKMKVWGEERSHFITLCEIFPEMEH